jgi:hypothetical protein
MIDSPPLKAVQSSGHQSTIRDSQSAIDNRTILNRQSGNPQSTIGNPQSNPQSAIVNPQLLD